MGFKTLLLLLVMPLCCQANGRLAAGSMLWVQQHLGAQSTLHFDNYQFSDGDIRDSRQKMQWQTRLNPDVRFTSQLQQNYQQLNAGVCSQTLETITYQMSSGVQIQPSLWLGLGYSDYLHGEADFGLQQRVSLQQGQTWFMQATLGEWSDNARLQVRLATARFIAHHRVTSSQRSHFADNSLSVTYRLTF